MKKRALVTGGCGFIGSHLIDVLVQRDYEVMALDTLFHGDINLKNISHLEGKVDVSRTDIKDRSAVQEAFVTFRPNHVYHLAAHHFIPYCNTYPVEAIETNITGTQNIADACAKYGAESLFFASTAAVYGISDVAHSEAETPDPLDIYGVTKAAGEKIMKFLSRGSAVKVRIGRYFNAVGNRETNPHIIPEIVKQLTANPFGPLRLGNVAPKRDYIHAADLAEASYLLLSHENAESIDTANLGSGSEVSVEQLVQLFGKALGRELQIQTDSTRTRKNDRPHLCADVSKLQQKYGWNQQHSLQEAINDLAAEIK